MFIVAELPATTSEPNEFIADWITTFESEKIVPCNPAGIPMAITLFNMYGSIFKSERVSFNSSLFSLRYHIISAAYKYSDTTVAIATPATPIEKHITRRRFSNMFNTPEIVRK